MADPTLPMTDVTEPSLAPAFAFAAGGLALGYLVKQIGDIIGSPFSPMPRQDLPRGASPRFSAPFRIRDDAASSAPSAPPFTPEPSAPPFTEEYERPPAFDLRQPSPYSPYRERLLVEQIEREYRADVLRANMQYAKDIAHAQAVFDAHDDNDDL